MAKSLNGGWVKVLFALSPQLLAVGSLACSPIRAKPSVCGMFANQVSVSLPMLLARPFAGKAGRTPQWHPTGLVATFAISAS